MVYLIVNNGRRTPHPMAVDIPRKTIITSLRSRYPS